MTNITEEQRAAWQRLSNRPGANLKPGATVEADAALIEPLLPSDLTNRQRPLPTVPGYYLDIGMDIWLLTEEDEWIPIWSDGHPLQHTTPHSWGPFTRLVPERSPITGDTLRGLYNAAPADASAFDYMAAELANGTARD